MPEITLGVIADTHIPDRARDLPLTAIDLFSKRGVSAILHAGDLSSMQVVHQLEEVAPTYAIRGNTDVLFAGQLPYFRRLEFEGVTIGMAHGHGNWFRYIPDKIDYFLNGPKKFSYYENIALSQMPGRQVVVCGHTHVPANYKVGDQLLFNPGSPTIPTRFVPGLQPSVGLLHIDSGNIRGEIAFI
ncbi:MAG: metallophosphoesterase family protein [Anaerolineales bacterium]|jgi:putative phosphoesterase